MRGRKTKRQQNGEEAEMIEHRSRTFALRYKHEDAEEERGYSVVIGPEGLRHATAAAEDVGKQTGETEYKYKYNNTYCTSIALSVGTWLGDMK
jgi:hypothetical protein